MSNNDKQRHMPKKKTASSYIPYALLAVALIIICTWAGFVLQETAVDGQHNMMTAINEYEKYLTVSDFVTAFKQALIEKNEYPRKGLLIGFITGMIIFAYFATQKEKRFHRKGEEHGSAKWGTEKEKDMIRDKEDFYNNVIAASDVLLVLDRKKRDLNAMTERQKQQAEKRKKQERTAEEKRVQSLREDIHKFIGESEISNDR